MRSEAPGGKVIVPGLLAACAALLAGCSAAHTPERPPTRVVSVSPRGGAADIDPRALAQIHFSTGLDLSTIAADAIRILGPGSAPVPARLGFDIEGDVVNRRPHPARGRGRHLPPFRPDVGRRLTDAGLELLERVRASPLD